MAPATKLYIPLPQTDPKTDFDLVDEPIQGHSRPSPKLRLVAAISLAFNLLLAICLGLKWSQSSVDSSCQLTYSPAENAIEYKTTLFRGSLGGDMTEYQGDPSPDLDQAWSNLYYHGMTTISQEEADQLLNKTDKMLAGDKPEYVVQLAVFHQLHCINMFRMSLDPEYYHNRSDPEYLAPWHLSHYLDNLRQAVMCNADVTPFVYNWMPEFNAYKGRLNLVHSCRNFDKVSDWAKERQIKGPLNMTFRVLEDK